MPAAGIPKRFPVAPSKVTPEGSAPDSESVGAGMPVAVTVNDPTIPAVKVALFALVIAAD